MNQKSNITTKEKFYSENDELIIEDNTIYEIDLNCYECLSQKRKNEKMNNK